jgi:hypothetical protein
MKLTQSLAILALGATLATPLTAGDKTYRTVNLSSYCNIGLNESLIGGSSFPSMSFASVPFEVSGIIQLSSQRGAVQGRNFPESVTGIKVESACKTLNVLHAARWNAASQTKIATLTLNYADGDKREIPIVYGKHVCDWLDNQENPSDESTTVAWTGANRVTKAAGTDLRIYKTTFVNPRPGATIASVDFVSARKEAAPLLLGLTLE